MTHNRFTDHRKQTLPVRREFIDSEDLRCLLCRLHEQGEGAWVHDPVAADLMHYARDKYAALAVKHRLDPWEAVSAAFEVMRTPAARRARDPWAVITHSVRITCSVEERGQGLLCSVHQARRKRFTVFHDPERFSDREHPMVDDHPVFRVIDEHFNDLDTPEPDPVSTPVLQAAEGAITLLVLLGWPGETARDAVEHVCDALTKAGARQAAYSALRRDQQTPAMLDLPRPAWHALLRALLGSTEPVHAATPMGRGVLLRLLIGETIPVLLEDDDLVAALSLASSGVGEVIGDGRAKGWLLRRTGRFLHPGREPAPQGPRRDRRPCRVDRPSWATAADHGEP